MGEFSEIFFILNRMRKRKLYLLLILLSPEDLSGLKHYLMSPLFQSSKTLTRFLDLWRRKLLKDQNGPELDVEQFLKGSPFTPARMDKLCSQLYQKTTEYLSLREFQGNVLSQQEMFFKALEKRKAGAVELSKQYDRLQGQLKKVPDSADKRLLHVKLRWVLAEATTTARDTQSLWREGFQDLHQLTDEYHQLLKLKLASASANASHIFNQENLDSSDSFMARFEEREMELSPLVHGFYLAVEMFRSENGTEYFSPLMELLDQESQNFEESEAKELYGYAINFCIRKENEGFAEYRSHTAALYRQLLDKGFLLEDGKIHPTQMKNLVTLNCRLGNLEWVSNFIDTYKNRLQDGTEPYVVTYNEGVLAFYQQAYGSSIRLLKEVITKLKDDVFYELGTRVYLWKSYFEHREHLSLEEVDEMYKMYDAFRVFLERNQKISEAHKTNYKVFIRIFKRLIVILDREEVSKESLQSLREEIAAMPSMVNKIWFLQKIDSVMEKFAKTA